MCLNWWAWRKVLLAKVFEQLWYLHNNFLGSSDMVKEQTTTESKKWTYLKRKGKKEQLKCCLSGKKISNMSWGWGDPVLAMASSGVPAKFHCFIIKQSRYCKHAFDSLEELEFHIRHTCTHHPINTLLCPEFKNNLDCPCIYKLELTIKDPILFPCPRCKKNCDSLRALYYHYNHQMHLAECQK